MEDDSIKNDSEVKYSIEQVPEVQKDLKKIRVQGFDEDFERFLKALPNMVNEKEYYHHHRFSRVSKFGRLEGEVYIAKKIHCKSLHSKKKFRVAFQIIGDKIRIIEVYYKGNKEIEDKARILHYCKAS